MSHLHSVYHFIARPRSILTSLLLCMPSQTKPKFTKCNCDVLCLKRISTFQTHKIEFKNVDRCVLVHSICCDKSFYAIVSRDTAPTIAVVIEALTPNSVQSTGLYPHYAHFFIDCALLPPFICAAQPSLSESIRVLLFSCAIRKRSKKTAKCHWHTAHKC